MDERRQAHLDRLLTTWAAAQRLGDDEADRLVGQIVAQPRPTLAPAWWADFSGQVSAAMVRAMARPSPGGWAVQAPSVS
ncbi:hypothetical protein [Egicoccus sp. AB-alg2]|uniref:hypothetical protein n=1 Tax=Egicoccus sp. AB-alg2 TaxID=3242693 RepID=UPI00359E294F